MLCIPDHARALNILAFESTEIGPHSRSDRSVRKNVRLPRLRDFAAPVASYNRAFVRHPTANGPHALGLRAE
jgi:hypothetical protein